VFPKRGAKVGFQVDAFVLGCRRAVRKVALAIGKRTKKKKKEIPNDVSRSRLTYQSKKLGAFVILFPLSWFGQVQLGPDHHQLKLVCGVHGCCLRGPTCACDTEHRFIGEF
jgi:hypothetical protein